jgi:hypothetical protein
LKRATRWYAWEQVNFNAAVHHALRDLLQLLSNYEQEMRTLRAQIEAEASARESDRMQHQAELTAQRAELSVQLGDVIREVRAGDENARDEQRVCFKQLALETSEAAVLEDRARRRTGALLEELKRRIEQLEKK